MKMSSNAALSIASFNKPVTVADLIGKLKIAAWYESQGQTEALLLENIYNDGEDWVITDRGANLGLPLQIIGNAICVTQPADTSLWIFDVDYDQQHKKDLTLADGYYYLKMPDLVKGGISEPMYAIVEILAEGDGIEAKISEQGTELMATNASGSDIDVVSPFNNVSTIDNTSKVITMLGIVIEMEYNGSKDVFSGYEAVIPTPIKQLNMFSDGTPHPMPSLSMVSRKGSILAADLEAAGSNGIALCKFSRVPNVDELAGLLKVVVAGGGGDVQTLSFNANSGPYDGSFDGAFGHLYVKISNNTIYVIGNENYPYVFDVDFNNQHQKELEIISDTEDVPEFITSPALIGVSAENIVVCFYNNDDDPPVSSVIIYKNADNTYLRTWDDTTGQFNFTTLLPGINIDEVSDILKEIMKMEYSNAGDFVFELNRWENQDQDWAPIIRPFNLLTDNTVQLPA